MLVWISLVVCFVWILAIVLISVHRRLFVLGVIALGMLLMSVRLRTMARIVINVRGSILINVPFL